MRTRMPRFMDNDEWFNMIVDEDGGHTYELTDKAPKDPELIAEFEQFVDSLHETLPNGQRVRIDY